MSLNWFRFSDNRTKRKGRWKRFIVFYFSLYIYLTFLHSVYFLFRIVRKLRLFYFFDRLIQMKCSFLWLWYIIKLN